MDENPLELLEKEALSCPWKPGWPLLDVLVIVGLLLIVAVAFCVAGRLGSPDYKQTP